MTDTSNVKNTHNGHTFVDLGLPSGLLWATCNVGADSPEQAGRYFAWGETTGYTAEQVKAGEKIFNIASYKAKNLLRTDLTLEQDAAHAYMGGKWRMPTNEEFGEMIANCNAEWKEDYNDTGVNGYVFTSKVNGNSVFFPAAGYCYDSSVYGQGTLGDYWFASWFSSEGSWGLGFNPGYIFTDGDLYRCFGRSVRGVCK